MDIAAAWRTWVSDTTWTGTAPVGVVEAAVGAAGFAGDALAVERLTHGELNEAYRVGREDRPSVIVRLSRQVPSTFARERWAIAAAAAQGVPRAVPRRSPGLRRRDVGRLLPRRAPHRVAAGGLPRGRPGGRRLRASPGTLPAARRHPVGGALVRRLHRLPAAGRTHYDRGRRRGGTD